MTNPSFCPLTPLNHGVLTLMKACKDNGGEYYVKCSCGISGGFIRGEDEETAIKLWNEWVVNNSIE